MLSQSKSHIDLHTAIMGDFHTQLLLIDRSSRQKLNREMLKLNNVLSQVDLPDIFKTFHPSTEEIYLLFSSFEYSSPKLTEQVSTDTGKLKLHPALYLTTVTSAAAVTGSIQTPGY